MPLRIEGNEDDRRCYYLTGYKSAHRPDIKHVLPIRVTSSGQPRQFHQRCCLYPIFFNKLSDMDSNVKKRDDDYMYMGSTCTSHYKSRYIGLRAHYHCLPNERRFTNHQTHLIEPATSLLYASWSWCIWVLYERRDASQKVMFSPYYLLFSLTTSSDIKNNISRNYSNVITTSQAHHKIDFRCTRYTYLLIEIAPHQSAKSQRPTTPL